MRRTIYSILLVLSGTFCLAQDEPLWKIKIAHDWHRVTSLGYLVVGSTGRLSGLDPETGAQLWQRTDLGTLQENQVEEIIGTSLLRVAYGLDDPDDTDMPMIGIVDMITGQTVFDSNVEDLGVLATYVLPKSGNLMVVGVKPGQFSARLLMYDLENGKMLWKNEDIFKASAGGKGGLLGKMAAAVKTATNMQALVTPPLELDDESIVIVHPSYIIRLRSDNGNQLWRATIGESVSASIVLSPAQPERIFVGAAQEMATSMMNADNPGSGKSFATTYYALDKATGQVAWKSSTVTEALNMTVPIPEGLAVFYGNNPKSTLNLLDYASGNGKWGNKGKGIKTLGSVIGYIPTDNGMVLCLGGTNVLTSKGEEYYLNILDPATGELRFDKSVNVKGKLLSAEVTPKGILYTTTHEVNILNTTNGSMVLASPIESETSERRRDRPFPTLNTEKYMYVFATRKGLLMELDKNTGAVRSLNAAPLELGGKEFPKSLDLFEEGIVVSSDQNVAMIGFDGKLKHMKYYQPPLQSGWVRAIALAEAVQGVYLGALTIAAAAVINDAGASSGDPNLKKQAQVAAAGTAAMSIYAFAYAGQALNDFRRRVKATTTTDEYLLLVSEPVKRDIKLLQVDKKTGNVLTTMDIGKDRDPQYSVDFIDRKVFYLSRPNELTCFKIK